MNILTYKGLSAIIGFDADDMILTGRIAGIGDIIGFHAETAEGIADAFHEAVDDYLAACAKIGKQPEKPYSGKLMLRVSPKVHAEAALAAELAGMSLNQWGEQALAWATIAIPADPADPENFDMSEKDVRVALAARMKRGRNRVQKGAASR